MFCMISILRLGVFTQGASLGPDEYFKCLASPPEFRSVWGAVKTAARP